MQSNRKLSTVEYAIILLLAGVAGLVLAVVRRGLTVDRQRQLDDFLKKLKREMRIP